MKAIQKLYMVITSYRPNTAETNRRMSFIHGLSELGVDTEVVFVIPDEAKSRVKEELPHIKFHYLWERQKTSNRYLNFLLYSVYSARFVKHLKPGDSVLVMDTSRILFPLLKRKDLQVFNMKDEHPFAYHVRTININKYVQACKQLDGLFVISSALKEYFIQTGVSKDKVHIINMTVDSNRFSGIRKQGQKQKYLAYCGTASNTKDGVDELIKAFAIVSKRHPEVKLYIIGRTPSRKEETGNLHLIKELGLEDKIVLTGIVPAEKMPQMLTNAEVLLLDRPDSLQAKNGFPTKLGEYLLTGNPVVVTAVGDIPLFLKDGFSAMIAQERNAEQFAEKTYWLLEHPKEAEEIGRKGREVALKNFNYLTETKKLLSIIENDTH